MSLRLVRGRLSAEARRDLMDIQDYMLEHAAEYWPAVRNRLEQGIAKITSRPALGRRRSDLVADKYRFYLVHPYFLIFEQGKRGVVVTRILHSARDIAAILGDD